MYSYLNYLTILSLCLIGLLSPNKLAGQEYKFKIFAHDDEQNPLPKSAITYITQDKDGFIWMAPYASGASKYDGSKLTNYTKKEGIAEDIFSIKQDSTSRLWFACLTNGFFASEKPLDAYQINDSIRFVKKIDSLELPQRKGSITQSDIAIDHQGNIWTSIDSFLFKLHYNREGQLLMDTVLLNEIPQTDKSYPFSSMAIKSDGQLLFSRSINHLYFYQEASNSIQSIQLEYTNDESIKDQSVQNLFISPDDVLYAITKNSHLIEIDLKKSNQTTIIAALTGKSMKSIQFMDGKLLISTVGDGLIYYDPKLQVIDRVIDSKNGLPSNIIWNTFHDNGGHLWLATNNGVARIAEDYLAFGYYSDINDVLPTKEANNVKTHLFLNLNHQSSKHECIAVSSQKGLTILKKSGEREIINTENGLHNNSVMSCHQDGKGRLFILTAGGISCIAPTKNGLLELGVKTSQPIQLFGQQMFIGTTPITQHTNCAESVFLALSPDNQQQEETLWFIGKTGVWVFVDAHWYYISKESGVDGKGFNNLTVDQEGYIYLSETNKGIFRSVDRLSIEDLKNASVNGVWKENEALSQTTNHFFEQLPITYKGDTVKGSIFVLYYDGKLWSSSDKGLVAIDLSSRKVVKVFKQSDPKARPTPIGFIGIPDQHRLWAAGTGIYSINTTTMEIEREVSAKDGLVSDIPWGLPGLDMDMDGKLYYATNKGLSFYSPLLDKVDTIAPKARVTHLEVNYPTIHSNEVLLEYTGLSYGQESKVRFKTKLKGHDELWSDESMATNIRYTNLSAFLFPKRYEFLLKAVDVHGNWQAQPSSIQFSIKPVFYLHWLAILLYAFLLYFIIRWYTHYRTAQLIKKQEELEATIKERTSEVVAEKERSEELLLNILPAEIAEELKQTGSAKAKNFDQVTVLFTDFKGFTALAEKLKPEDLIKEIDYCFRAFDHIIEKYNVEKIKTIGDAYMAVCGLPTEKENHAKDAISAAFEIRDFMFNYKKEKDKNKEMAFEMRIGLHSGPVVAGIVGIKKFAYDIWGDTVNIASRMESNGAVNKINISEETYHYLIDSGLYEFEFRGKIEAKNRGELAMYFIEKK